MEHIAAYLRQHRQEHLDWLLELCRFPSVSTKAEHGRDVRDAVHWMRGLCERIGLRASVHETGGHPLVYAEHCQLPSGPTFLVYGHVDVQPEGDLGLWDAGPFAPVVDGDRLICRGSADDKGQVLVHVRAAAAWLAAEKRLPINLKFLIEGEEEISSPNLAAFLRAHTDLLACDHILISDTGMYADGWPTITYGTRGLLYKEIRIHGPRHDLHSGSFGGSIANPANVLARIIAGLHDGQSRVTLPGFYDDVRPLTESERESLRKLPLNEAAYAADVGAPATAGEAGYTTNERRWIRPTLDVNGIYGGFMRDGANTIIPSKAGAKISMRLVPDQRSDKIDAAFHKSMRKRCPDTVRLEILHHGAADRYVAPLDSPPMEAAKRALAEVFGREPALVREGGTLPILPLFKSVLGADSLMIGFAGPNCNAHGPNENIRLSDLDRGAEAVARLFAYLGS